MARTTRIVLDMALVSLEKARPVVSKAWCTTKCYVKDTRAKPLLCNPIVSRIEMTLDNITGSLWMKLKSLRDKQLPAEVEYLQRELEKVKKKLTEDRSLKSAAKNVKSFGATAWRYLKVEAVPPFTGGFFRGPAGQKMENFVGKTADGFIGLIAGRIREMDAEAERQKIERAAEIKALEEKLKAEAKRKVEEALKAVAAKAAEEAKKAKAAAEKKLAEEKAKEKLEKKDAKPEKKAAKPEKKPKKKKPKDRKTKKKKPTK